MNKKDSDPDLQDNDVVRLSTGVILRDEKFGGLAITLQNDNLYIFNKVGFRILALCRDGTEFGKVVRGIEQAYRIPNDTAKRDVLSFVRDSTRKGLTYFRPAKNQDGLRY